MNYPKAEAAASVQRNITVFGGYHHKPVIHEGEWFDDCNLSTKEYPLLSQRDTRMQVSGIHLSTVGIAGGQQAAWVEGSGGLYYGGYFTGLNLDPTTEKQFLHMGSYLIIWPDRKYLNTAQLSDHGSIDCVTETDTSLLTAEFSLCMEDGEACTVSTAGTSEPDSPVNGMLWLDTSSLPHVIRQYSSSEELWTDIPTVFVKIAAAGIGTGFSAGDGITLSGITAGAAGSSLQEQTAALNGANILAAAENDYIIITGIIDQSFQQTSGIISVKREAPEMDFITEAQNRIWGCKYGLINGEPVNSLYCCELGNFRNWNLFEGISTDSWAASVGSDGPFTGSISLGGCPLFFKEKTIHKIYPSSSGAHQVITAEANGVQSGCHNSMQIIEETLYYRARNGIYAYTGALPRPVSEALGDIRCCKACAGALGNLYYLSLSDESGTGSSFVFDTERGVWHREAYSGAVSYAAVGNTLLWETSGGSLFFTGSDSFPGLTAEAEQSLSWSAESGTIGIEDPDHKYLRRFRLRCNPQAGSLTALSVQYDSSGVWEPLGTVQGPGLKSITLPLAARRCDHVKLKLAGTGRCTVYSIAFIYEEGSF